MEGFVESDQKIGLLSIDFPGGEDDPGFRFPVRGVEESFRIGAARMHLQGKAFGGVEEFGQNGGFRSERFAVFPAEDLLRVLPQEFRKGTNLPFPDDFADAVSGRVIGAAVAFDAGGDPVLREAGVFRLRLSAESVDSASSRVKTEDTVVCE